MYTCVRKEGRVTASVRINVKYLFIYVYIHGLVSHMPWCMCTLCCSVPICRMCKYTHVSV